MVKADFDLSFKKLFSKIKDKPLKERIIKQFLKIKENPKVGKPMKYSRRGTREVYIKPFRLAYLYIEEEDKVIFMDLYHKDKQ